MQPNLAAAFVLFALVLLAVLRWRMAQPFAEDAGTVGGWPPARGKDQQEVAAGPGDEEQPETDLKPRRMWPVGLSAAVAVTAILRVALLVTLHA